MCVCVCEKERERQRGTVLENPLSSLWEELGTFNQPWCTIPLDLLSWVLLHFSSFVLLVGIFSLPCMCGAVFVYMLYISISL